ncbi:MULTISPECIES: Arm DNA-binding domain-containing protein [Cupriavidus]
MPLTDAACRNALPQAKTYRLADGGGMYLEVPPTGSKYWRLKYRFGGNEKRRAFGVYPEMSLATARKRREDARQRLAAGIAPPRQKSRPAGCQAGRRQLVARGWIEEHQSTVEPAQHNAPLPSAGWLIDRCTL